MIIFNANVGMDFEWSQFVTQNPKKQEKQSVQSRHFPAHFLLGVQRALPGACGPKRNLGLC